MKDQFIVFLLVAFFLLASVSCEPKRDEELSFPEKVKSVERFFHLYLRFSARIKSITNYNASERELALAKFLEIHDELLELLSSAGDEVERSSIDIILQYLDKNVQKSVLMRKNSLWSKIMNVVYSIVD